MSVVSIETKIVEVAKKIRDGIEVAGEDILKLASFVQASQPELNALASLAGSKAASVENVAAQVLGLVVPAVKASTSAADANGLSITLDAAAVASVRTLIAELEKL